MRLDSAMGGSQSSPGSVSGDPIRLPSFWWSLLVFLALALGIGLAGYTYHKHEEGALIAETQKALASIAELKIAQIVDWREEQIRDAIVAAKDHSMVTAMVTLLQNPRDLNAKEEIVQALDTLKRVYLYQQVCVLDLAGNPLVAASGDEPETGKSMARQIEQVSRTRTPFLSDLHAEDIATPHVHMDALAPIQVDDPAQPLVGFILIRIDPARFLFPLIQSWPVPSESAESLLVRREGDKVRFLNGLRHRDNPAMSLEFPVTDPELPAARVARGESGAIRGIDYRGTRVLGFMKAIPSTPWFLVAKVDEREALAPSRSQRLFLAGFIGVMILAAGLAAALLFNRQRAGAYRQLYHLQEERLEAVKALRESQEVLHLAQEAANAGSWEWDLRTDKNFWSEELWRLYGLEPHSCEPSYDVWARTVHPDDRPKAELAVQEAARTRTEINTEWRVLHADNSERWLMSRGKPIRDEKGETVRYVGIVMDITERKRIEMALRQWADAFTYCAHGIAIGLSTSDTILTCNPAYASMRGLTVEEISGMPILNGYDPSEHDHLRRCLAEADEKGQVQFESLMKHHDGFSFPVQIDVVSVRDVEGRLLYRVATAQDIRRRKEAVNALRSSLEDKVALLKEVHHRVKNNLQIVASLLSLQANRSRSSEVIEVLKDTGNRVRSMALLHEVLYASGTLASINFASYVEDLCRHLVRSYGQVATKIKVVSRVERIGLPLEQSVPCGLIINELVSNALKHAFPDDRSGQVTVELRPTEDRKLFLCVRDDGVGLRREFEPGANSTLGLQLVANLAGQLGGQLTVSQNDGIGTSFCVNFSIPEGILSEV
ncbi:MAG: sensor histidine kinase [Syntrophobacteraceae bacterium]